MSEIPETRFNGAAVNVSIIWKLYTPTPHSPVVPGIRVVDQGCAGLKGSWRKPGLSAEFSENPR
jgi:hypothetical protein